MSTEDIMTTIINADPQSRGHRFRTRDQYLPLEVRDVFKRLDAVRIAYIHALHDAGWTDSAIGSAISVSRERVRQLRTFKMAQDVELGPAFPVPVPLEKSFPHTDEGRAKEPSPEMLARLLELKPLATRRGRSISPAAKDASEEFSKILRYLVNKEGVTMGRLAGLLGITASTIWVRVRRNRPAED